MKNILGLVLTALLLSVAGPAAGGGYPPPLYYDEPYYYPPPRYVPMPRDVRVMIAEFERLKAEMHYYSLSDYPPDRARAAHLSARMAFLSQKIEAWRLGWR